MAGIEIRPGGERDADVFTGKLDYLSANIGRYDTIYIGSSRTFRGFKAEDFDRAMAQHGLTTSTFNLGIPGLNGLETVYVARRILAMENQDLRRLIVAPDWGFRLQIDQRLAHLDRIVIWHDLAGTRSAIEAVMQGDGNAWEKAVWILNNVDAYFTNVLAIGRISNRLGVRSKSPSDLVLGPAGDGHVGLDYEVETAPYPDLLKRKETLANASQFERITATVAKEHADPLPEPKEWELAYVESLIELGRLHGVEIVFVMEPSVNVGRPQFLREAAARDQDVRLADLSDPVEYPELYERQMYFDRGHLNDKGAALFTALLAETLYPLYSEGS